MIASFVVATAVWAVDCPTRTRVAQIDEVLGQAETAYGELDVGAFNAALDQIPFVLPCLEDAVPPATAARYHRLVGLRLYGEADSDVASTSLTAARHAEPEYSFTGLLPEGHPVHALFEGLEVAERKTVRVPEPAHGSLAFDGVRGRDRPRDEPVIVQVVGATGSVEATAYVAPGQPMPLYATIPRLRTGLIAGSAALAAGSIALNVGAFYTKGRYDSYTPPKNKPQQANADLDAFQSRITQLNAAAGSLAVVASGGAVAAVLVGRR